MTCICHSPRFSKATGWSPTNEPSRGTIQPHLKRSFGESCVRWPAIITVAAVLPRSVGARQSYVVPFRFVQTGPFAAALRISRTGYLQFLDFTAFSHDCLDGANCLLHLGCCGRPGAPTVHAQAPDLTGAYVLHHDGGGCLRFGGLFRASAKSLADHQYCAATPQENTGFKRLIHAGMGY